MLSVYSEASRPSFEGVNTTARRASRSLADFCTRSIRSVRSGVTSSASRRQSATTHDRRSKSLRHQSNHVQQTSPSSSSMSSDYGGQRITNSYHLRPPAHRSISSSTFNIPYAQASGSTEAQGDIAANATLSPAQAVTNFHQINVDPRRAGRYYSDFSLEMELQQRNDGDRTSSNSMGCESDFSSVLNFPLPPTSIPSTNLDSVADIARNYAKSRAARPRQLLPMQPSAEYVYLHHNLSFHDGTNLPLGDDNFSIAETSTEEHMEELQRDIIGEDFVLKSPAYLDIPDTVDDSSLILPFNQTSDTKSLDIRHLSQNSTMQTPMSYVDTTRTPCKKNLSDWKFKAMDLLERSQVYDIVDDTAIQSIPPPVPHSRSLSSRIIRRVASLASELKHINHEADFISPSGFQASSAANRSQAYIRPRRWSVNTRATTAISSARHTYATDAPSRHQTVMSAEQHAPESKPTSAFRHAQCSCPMLPMHRYSDTNSNAHTTGSKQRKLSSGSEKGTEIYSRLMSPGSHSSFPAMKMTSRVQPLSVDIPPAAEVEVVRSRSSESTGRFAKLFTRRSNSVIDWGKSLMKIGAR